MLTALLLAPLAAAADPVAPACSVLVPRYTVDGKLATMGAMFAVKVGEQTALVTAHDLFGPNGGLPAQLGPDEVVARVPSLTAYDVDRRTECGRSTHALKVEGAVAATGGDASHDVAVFQPVLASGLEADRVMSRSFAPLPLATAVPKVGDAVWLAFPVGGVPVQAAKVVELLPGAMYLEYADKDLDVGGTVGAPILDASGAVVGMSVGYGKMSDGALIGTNVPLPALRDRVTSALAKP